MWPKCFDVQVTHIPYQLMSEYIMNMFSCSGFWLGTSFLTIWSDLISIKNFSTGTKTKKVAPSNVSEHSTFVAINRIVRRIDMVVNKISAIEGKVSTIEEKKIEQGILWQQMNQLQSKIRSHDAFINKLISRTNDWRPKLNRNRN